MAAHTYEYDYMGGWGGREHRSEHGPGRGGAAGDCSALRSLTFSSVDSDVFEMDGPIHVNCMTGANPWPTAGQSNAAQAQAIQMLARPTSESSVQREAADEWFSSWLNTNTSLNATGESGADNADAICVDQWIRLPRDSDASSCAAGCSTPSVASGTLSLVREDSGHDETPEVFTSTDADWTPNKTEKRAALRLSARHANPEPRGEAVASSTPPLPSSAPRARHAVSSRVSSRGRGAGANHARQSISKTTKKVNQKRRFACTWPKCVYASDRKANLGRHWCTHTGEKPFKCKTCDYASADEGAMTRHENRHNGIHNIRCKYPGCDWSTTEPSNYKRHMWAQGHDAEMTKNENARRWARPSAGAGAWAGVTCRL